MKRHDIKRINPKPKVYGKGVVEKVTPFQTAINGLKLDMENARLINIKNKYE